MSDDYESIQRRRNVIVGLFVVVALGALFWMVFKFGDLPVFVSEWKSFKVMVQFPMAPGVQENTPVQFCGYQIGRVTDVEPPKILKDLSTGRFYHQTMVVLSIDKEYDNIPASVEVKLMARGLGSSYIELRARPFDVKEPDGEFLVAGSLLQGSTGMTSEFFPEESQKKLDELADSLKTLIDNANDVLGDEANKENLKTTLANLSDTSKRAAEALKEFQEFSAAALSTSEELSKTAAELRVILEKINNGQGSAAKFINDGRLYENLLENTEQLQALLEDLRSFMIESRKKGLPIKVK